jgi:carbon monoxide dehydrogenase subunit G
MANGKHTIELPVSIEKVWTYIRDIDNWAATVPGYEEHEIVNEKQSTWAIKGDMGILKKTAKLQVEINEWVEPKKVAFQFRSLSEDFVGKGHYEADVIDNNHTRITGYLEIETVSTKGPLATMQKTVLKKFVPKTTKDITTAVANQIKTM